jgi:hypothetical protein
MKTLAVYVVLATIIIMLMIMQFEDRNRNRFVPMDASVALDTRTGQLCFPDAVRPAGAALPKCSDLAKSWR